MGNIRVITVSATYASIDLDVLAGRGVIEDAESMDRVRLDVTEWEVRMSRGRCPRTKYRLKDDFVRLPSVCQAGISATQAESEDLSWTLAYQPAARVARRSATGSGRRRDNNARSRRICGAG